LTDIIDAPDIHGVQFVQQSSDVDAPDDGLVRFFFRAAGAFFRRHGEAAIRLLTELDLSNLTFPSGARIKGDFSNSTLPSRTLIQTSTTNGNTTVGAIPNGTATVANYQLFNSSDPANAGMFFLGIRSDYAQLASGKTGTGTALPIAILVDGNLAQWLDLAGNSGFGAADPTCRVDINDDVLRLRTAKTPSSASDTGNQGDWCWDSNYLYVCTATNTWKRSALSTW